MAIEAHVNMLWRGKAVWNAWKQEHPDETIDLSGINLSGTDLSGVDLRKANLNRANLNGVDLSGATLIRATLIQTTFIRATLIQANLSGATLIQANLSGTNLSKTELNRANFREADLSGATLSGANLSGANLNRTDLKGADLSFANLSGATLIQANLNRTDLIQVILSRVNFRGAILSNINFSKANLSRINFSGADLSGADLSGTDLRETNFKETTLRGADLSEADLSGADLREANFRETILIRATFSRAIVGWTVFGDVDLHTAIGLETIQHYSPSYISTSTLSRSQGDIPDIFLRGAGLNDTFITYVRSLVQFPIQYYTCFISYSSKDQEFVERLYADLQHNGVRCWYAPEDLTIGEHFPERIEEAIRLYDKLIVILSEHSIKSSWVEDEARAAQEKEERFKREQQLTKTILFPIKIDHTIDQATVQWAARLRRQRHIGNFIDWKHHDSYQKTFQRLLRDLQQAPTKDEPPHNRTP